MEIGGEQMKNKNGITLIALVVTIIVLLILAGISLNLIAGSNGIMERATKAVDTYDYAKLEESLELSNAEMLIDCLGGGDLQTDLYDYIVQRCNENADKTAQTANGKYWIDSDGRLCYTDSDTNRSVKLRKDSNGNPKIIDPNAPITTYRVQYEANGGSGVPTDTSEYEEGDKVNVNFGTTPTREKYTFLGWAKSASATTPDYTAGASFTMGEQNVTLYAVWTGISGVGTSIMKGAWYGDTVNYSANGCDNWKVFLNDGNNIYMIANTNVPNSGLNLAENIVTSDTTSVYASDNRKTLLDWLRTTAYWSEYASSIYAQSATGGPTLPQWAQSWNAKGYETLYTATRNMEDGLTGYYIGTSAEPTTTWLDISATSGCNDTLYFPDNSDNFFYWLVSPSAYITEKVMNSGYHRYLYNTSYNYTGLGVRPLVSLKSDVKMTWNGSCWDLSN